MLTMRYPEYKLIRDSKEVTANASVIINGEALKRYTRDAFTEEGFKLPESDEALEQFIVDSFQDVISKLVEYDAGPKYASIALLEKHHGKKWIGESTYVMDYAEMMLCNMLKRHKFGMWDIFFRNDAMFIIYKGSYAEAVYRYLQGTDSSSIPPLEELINYHITGSVSECGISDFR